MGSGAKIALVALLILMVVAVAKFVQNGGKENEETSAGGAKKGAPATAGRDQANLPRLAGQKAPGSPVQNPKLSSRTQPALPAPAGTVSSPPGPPEGAVAYSPARPPEGAVAYSPARPPEGAVASSADGGASSPGGAVGARSLSSSAGSAPVPLGSSLAGATAPQPARGPAFPESPPRPAARTEGSGATVSSPPGPPEGTGAGTGTGTGTAARGSVKADIVPPRAEGATAAVSTPGSPGTSVSRNIPVPRSETGGRPTLSPARPGEIARAPAGSLEERPELDRASPPPVGSAESAGRTYPVTHQVEPRESYWGIAQKYYGPAGARFHNVIAAANGGVKLKPGMKIKVPAPPVPPAALPSPEGTREGAGAAASAGSGGVGAPTAASKGVVSSDGRFDYYVVQRGDTLSGIAKRFYGSPTKTDAIEEANPSLRYATLQEGAKIRLPRQ